MIIVVEELDDPSIAANSPREDARQTEEYDASKDLLSTRQREEMALRWMADEGGRQIIRHQLLGVGEDDRRRMTVRPETLMKIGKHMDKRFKDAAGFMYGIRRGPTSE